MNMQTPLDVVQLLKNSQVAIDLKDGTRIEGKLLAFDLNTNITLEAEGKVKLIQGKNVLVVAKA